MTEEDNDRVRDALETLLAVETLEYHNKNWLAFDEKIRSEEKRSLLKWCLGFFKPSDKCAHT